jgi:Domain of unknown function (DUF5615)
VAAFYTDANVSLGVAPALRELGHQVVTARSLGQERATDDAQLLTATLRGLILLTHDIDDFQLLHDAWRRWPAIWGIAPRHNGILIAAQLPSPDLVAAQVDAFFQTAQPLDNELYRWRTATGWERRGSPRTFQAADRPE